ncbi:MAG: DUF1343 domain-containing protein [Bacteroidota bacterium]
MYKFGKFLQILSLLAAFFGLAFSVSCQSEPASAPAATQMARELSPEPPALTTGPDRFLQDHLAAMQGKRIGVVANHTARLIDGTHLVDSLIGAGLQVMRVFAPEHGFRGSADAGQKIEDGVDPKTGLPIVSLHGKRRKPTPEFLQDLDVVLFDIQDVGSRHYTYVSTMSLVMEACAEQGVPFWVLDRPNPNGWYVDGPMMEAGYTSFIGKHQVPIVHGMTIGEYAQMVNQEGWLTNEVQVELTVVSCEGYTHEMRWEDTDLPWIAPSPNIPTEHAAYLYPGLCWFEPTPMSIGRGTDSAFTILGAPWFEPAATARLASETLFFHGLAFKPHPFTPRSLPGKSTYPKFQDTECQGGSFVNRVLGKALLLAGLELLQLSHEAHQQSGSTENFFGKNFSTWAGNERLEQQLRKGDSPEAIYESWQAQTDAFRAMRKQYLLYPEE